MSHISDRHTPFFISDIIGIGTSEDPIILTYSTHALMANL